MIGAGEENLVNNSFETNTITVSSAEELKSALANVSGGETILLEAGSYGNFGLWDVRHPYVKFAEQVTIKSIDPADPAVFETMKLTGVENLTFDSGEIRLFCRGWCCELCQTIRGSEIEWNYIQKLNI